jgi:hypothetical protein
MKNMYELADLDFNRVILDDMEFHQMISAGEEVITNSSYNFILENRIRTKYFTEIRIKLNENRDRYDFITTEMDSRVSVVFLGKFV